MALAHAIPDAVEAAYRRGDLFDKRRKLMDAPGLRTAPRSRRTRARWSRSLVREQRDSIPEGAGPAGQPSHIFHRRCACPAPPRRRVRQSAALMSLSVVGESRRF